MTPEEGGGSRKRKSEERIRLSFSSRLNTPSRERDAIQPFTFSAPPISHKNLSRLEEIRISMLGDAVLKNSLRRS